MTTTPSVLLAGRDMARLRFIASQDAYCCSLTCWGSADDTSRSLNDIPLDPTEIYYDVPPNGGFSVDIDECAGSCRKCISDEEWNENTYVTAADIIAYVQAAESSTTS